MSSIDNLLNYVTESGLLFSRLGELSTTHIPSTSHPGLNKKEYNVKGLLMLRGLYFKCAEVICVALILAYTHTRQLHTHEHDSCCYTSYSN